MYRCICRVINRSRPLLGLFGCKRIRSTAACVWAVSRNWQLVVPSSLGHASSSAGAVWHCTASSIADCEESETRWTRLIRMAFSHSSIGEGPRLEMGASWQCSAMLGAPWHDSALCLGPRTADRTDPSLGAGSVVFPAKFHRSPLFLIFSFPDSFSDFKCCGVSRTGYTSLVRTLSASQARWRPKVFSAKRRSPCRGPHQASLKLVRRYASGSHHHSAISMEMT